MTIFNIYAKNLLLTILHMNTSIKPFILTSLLVTIAPFG